jgi:NDP-sugar pyrophosphorylase family protein
MKVMILAAGLGTRLKPLTDKIPKALVQINQKPMLQNLIERLIDFKITDIIINVHHFSGQIIQFLKERNNFGINIAVSDERDLLLDTGGGVKKASWFFKNEKSFLVHNVDAFTNIDLNKLIESHKTSNALASLAVKERENSRKLLFNNQNELCGWKNLKTDEEKIVRQNQNKTNELAFSGIQIMSRKCFDLMPEEKVFSLIDFYLSATKTEKISGFVHNQDYFVDLGRIENIKIAESILNKK